MRPVAALLLALAFGAAGCGGGGGGEEPEPAASAEKAVAATIKDFEYEPGEITVAAGGEVTWTNEDAANHTVTFKDEGVKTIANLREGQDGSVGFKAAGEFAYVCAYHPNMRGTVVVK